jgi:hypothetical protein
LYKGLRHAPATHGHQVWASSFIHWFSSSANSIAFASLAIAFVSAVYARRSAKISKRSLDLAELQDSRHAPKVNLYLSDAYSFTSEDHSVIVISITLTNPTDVDNSIIRAELGVSYHRMGGQSIKMKIASLPATSTALTTIADTLNAPITVPSHQSIAGLLVFEPPSMILKESVVDEYSLILSDSHDKALTRPDITVRESFSL